MQTNILKSSDVTSIYLIYTENYSRKKYSARIRFLDTKECYLSTDVPANFTKPKKKQDAEIVAYTEDGVYRAQVKIMETTYNGMELMFITELPSNWKYTQLRQSTRKKVKGDVKITFNDGYSITAETYDISLGGASFYMETEIPDLYKKISGIITVDLPSNSYANINSTVIKTEAKFLRMHSNKNNTGDSRYVFKFLGLSDSNYMQLKNYLIRLM